MRRNQQNGSTLTDVIVAAVLLTTTLGLFAPLSVSAARIWQQKRHHQLALDELSNQLDRLLTLSGDDLDEQLQQPMEPSDAAKKMLPEVSLTADRISDVDGDRVSISIVWNRGVPAEPLTLVGWLP